MRHFSLGHEVYCFFLGRGHRARRWQAAWLLAFFRLRAGKLAQSCLAAGAFLQAAVARATRAIV